MRDLIHRNTHVGYTIEYKTRPKVKPDRTASYDFSEAPSRRRGRSDIVQGNHRSATHYRAYDVSIRTNPFYLSIYYGSGTHYSFVNGKLKTTKYKEYRESSGKLPIEHHTLRFFGLNPQTYEPSVSQFYIDEARTKILNKLNEGKIDLGQTLGELSETRKGLNRSLGTFIRLLIACLTRKPPKGGWPKASPNAFAKARRDFFTAKSPAEAWLAIQLFWKPLISDMLNAQDAIIDLFNKDDPEFSVKAVVEGPPPGFLYPRHSFEGDVTQGVEMGITARLETSWVHELNKLGVANPLSLGWELAPLSFVADYFVGIGNFLSATTASAGLEFQHGYETRFVRGRGRVRRYWTPDGDIRWNPGYYEDSDGNKRDTYPSWDISAFSMQRFPLSEFPAARLALGSGLSSSNRVLTTTALALLRGRSVNAKRTRTGGNIPPAPAPYTGDSGD